MNNPNYGDWSTMTGPFAELSKLNQEASEKMIREYISFCTDNTGTVMKCMQTMPRVTSPEDFLNVQLKMMSQQGEKVLEFTQNIFKIYQDALKAHYHWTEDKVNTAFKTANKVKKASEERE